MHLIYQCDMQSGTSARLSSKVLNYHELAAKMVRASMPDKALAPIYITASVGMDPIISLWNYGERGAPLVESDFTDARISPQAGYRHEQLRRL